MSFEEGNEVKNDLKTSILSNRVGGDATGWGAEF